MFKEIPLSERTENRGSKRSLIYKKAINDAPYQTIITLNGVKYSCPYFTRWRNMLDRCYSPSWLKKHPTYVGCTVYPAWHSFMEFKKWMMTQNWEGKQLDKDLLSLGNKRYSPDTCLFVSRQVNSLFNERENAQGELPVGIYGRKGKYEVGVSYGGGKRSWVGSYNSILEAIDAYVTAKMKAVSLVLQNEQDKQVRTAVKNYAQYFTDKMNILKAGY